MDAEPDNNSPDAWLHDGEWARVGGLYIYPRDDGHFYIGRPSGARDYADVDSVPFENIDAAIAHARWLSATELHKRNVETFARRFAAKKMGLVKDRWGENLPDDLWQQCIPEAQRALSFEVTDRSHGYNHTTVQGTCPADAAVEEVKARFYHEYFGGRDAWVRDGRFGCTIHND